MEDQEEQTIDNDYVFDSKSSEDGNVTFKRQSLLDAIKNHGLSDGKAVLESLGRPQRTGLDYLTDIDRLTIHQQKSILEVIAGWKTKNKYIIKTSDEQQNFQAVEEYGDCSSLCLGSQRGFSIHIVDRSSQEIVRLNRTRQCCGVCCWCVAQCQCCRDAVYVECPVGVAAGSVTQRSSCSDTIFDVRDSSNTDIFIITSRDCPYPCGYCMDDVTFHILAASGEELGRIVKQSNEPSNMIFSNADNFELIFPADLDIRMKAVLIGAVFLIDFIFYEHRG